MPVEDSDDDSLQLLGWTEATATPQVEVALQHPKVTLIANALGTPPADMIKHIHDAGRKVAALCGSPSQARKHADAGVDIIIAQGGEAGGHCGEVGSIVLWPQVVKEVAPVPVLAAGGIGSGQQIAAALALGCQGAWTGSQWLMVEESENTPVQQAAYVKAGSRDTVRSRSFTGKPARMLRNDWTEAWEDAGQPEAARNAVAVHGVRHGGARPRNRYPNEIGRRRVQPGRSGRRAVHQGREDLDRHRALGAGVPGGDEPARRAERRGLRLSPFGSVGVVVRRAGEDLFGPLDGVSGDVDRVVDDVAGAAGDVTFDDVAGVFDDVRRPSRRRSVTMSLAASIASFGLKAMAISCFVWSVR